MTPVRFKQDGHRLADIIKKYKDKLLLVVFVANWCKPCQRLLNWVLPDVANQAGKEVAICLVNLQKREGDEAARTHKVPNVPTTLFFRGGKEIRRIQGFVEAKDILRSIKCYQKKEASH